MQVGFCLMQVATRWDDTLAVLFIDTTIVFGDEWLMANVIRCLTVSDALFAIGAATTD